MSDTIWSQDHQTVFQRVTINSMRDFTPGQMFAYTAKLLPAQLHVEQVLLLPQGDGEAPGQHSNPGHRWVHLPIQLEWWSLV